MLIGYTTFMDVVAKVFLGLGVFAGVICALDWGIRERKISPFSGTARFFRRTIDPMMRPLEGRIVRLGGQPSSAPLWFFLGIIVLGIVALQILKMIGGLLLEISVAASEPRRIPFLLLGWGFQFLIFALLFRVITTWLPVSPYSKWVRWSYTATEWLLAPLRKIVPVLGPFDITPIVAYFLLVIVQKVIGLS